MTATVEQLRTKFNEIQMKAEKIHLEQSLSQAGSGKMEKVLTEMGYQTPANFLLQLAFVGGTNIYSLEKGTKFPNDATLEESIQKQWEALENFEDIVAQCAETDQPSMQPG